MTKPPTRFASYIRRAQVLVSDQGRVQNLLRRGAGKLASASGDKFAELRAQLSLAMALIKAWSAGEYRQINMQTVVTIVAALLYFVVPMDVVPDFILVWGLLDDAAVLGYVFNQLSTELEAFRVWQAEQEQADNKGEGLKGEVLEDQQAQADEPDETPSDTDDNPTA